MIYGCLQCFWRRFHPFSSNDSKMAASSKWQLCGQPTAPRWVVWVAEHHDTAATALGGRSVAMRQAV